MAASTSTPITIKGKVLYTPEIKRTQRSEYGYVHICNMDILQIYFDPRFAAHLEAGEFVMISNVTPAGENTYRLHDTLSKVFSCAPCEVDEEKINLFRNPPVISVGEALSSPIKRKISVRGYLFKVGDTQISDTGARKFMKLSPTKNPKDSDVSIDVKLWGGATTNAVPRDAMVTVTNVTVQEYKGRRDLNSTNFTTIENCEVEEEFEIIIQAVSWSRPITSLISGDGEVLEVATNKLMQIYDVNYNNKDIINKTLKGTKRANQIIEVRF